MADIAFCAWNAFQVRHFRPLLDAMPEAVLMVERRSIAGAIDLRGLNVAPFEPRAHRVVVAQTRFPGMELVKRLALLQYGYAKGAHNWGDWRRGSVTLTYGRHATQRLRGVCETRETGNPGYDGLAAGSGGGVLYAPTWGPLSSMETHLQAVAAMALDWPVTIKAHHLTELKERDRWAALKRAGVRVCGAGDDLLPLVAAADVVISDYSGAIFDAVWFRKPIVLTNNPVQMGGKLDAGSIEVARRDEIGATVPPAGLSAAVRAATFTADALRRDLFNDEPGATQRAAQAIREMV